MRRWLELLSLGGLAVVGFTVGIAEQLGWLDKVAPKGVSTLTLIMVSGVVVVLLIELTPLRALEDIRDRLAGLDIDSIASSLRRSHYGGVVEVHKRFPDDAFAARVAKAKQITILNTWIPNLELLEHELEAAIVDRRAEVRIMLLHPNSMLVGLREAALGRTDGAGNAFVSTGITNCLETLSRLHRRLARRQGNLKVRVFNSQASVSVYRADGHYLVSMFLHGQLAINSPQFEIEGTHDTVLGEQIQRELDTLWDIGRDVDLGDWNRSIDMIRF
ncbi:hypothetical protein CFP75_08905 [Amycolatopsis alba DSM 44262]|uniref:Uncharacterized protein n=2 Tax=Amycolatopsis alba TaxID=76020 RepID=A0A229S290_AMYAL|nr:hypothetical protein CFP75_08905 [Amycolatopsis alba DSM 44262]